MSGWEVRFSNSKQLPYFFNAASSQSVWEKPTDLTDDQVAQLPGASKYLNGGGGGGAPKQVRSSHILAKHAGSRRPSSWRQDNITRSLDEARSIIQGHRDHLVSLPVEQQREQFAKIAAEMSDCSSAKKGGDLGFFGPGQMQKAFEVGTYSLDVGQISELIETDSGVHIILRTA